jgi:RsmE family RNA methyltransferase
VEDRLDGLFKPDSKAYRLLVDPCGTTNVASLIRGCDNCHIVAAIGPEGGWVEFERGLFKQQQFVPVSLGPWTLRVEYAVTALLAQLHSVQISSGS